MRMYRTADLPSHDRLAESLMGELAGSSDLDVEIQICHDEDALVAIEIVPDPVEPPIKVARNFAMEDFVTTMKFPKAFKAHPQDTNPYELVEVVPGTGEPASKNFQDTHRTNDFAASLGTIRSSSRAISGSLVSAALDPARSSRTLSSSVVLAAAEPARSSSPTRSLDTGWFAVSDDSLARMDAYHRPAARPGLFVTVLVLGALAVSLGVAIAMLAI